MAEKSFEELARHFSDHSPFFLNEVTVPTDDSRFRVSFRRDALSQGKLVLEVAYDSCDPCPRFFGEEVKCFVMGGVLMEPTRCQHTISKNSPRALASALKPVLSLLSTDRNRRMYGTQRKLQDGSDETRFPVGERFSMSAAISSSPAFFESLSDTAQSDIVPIWVFVLIGIASLVLLVGLAFLVRYLLKKYYPTNNNSAAAIARRRVARGRW